MKLDIVFVAYNSKKWLKSNLESILRSTFELSVSDIFIDRNGL